MKFLTLYSLASLAPLALGLLELQWEQMDEPQTSCAHHDFLVTDPALFLDRQDCEEIADLVDRGTGSWLVRGYDNGLEDWRSLTPLIAYGNCSVSVRRNDNRRKTFVVGSQDVRDFVDGALKNFANEFWVHLAYSESRCETYRSAADLNFYLGPYPLDTPERDDAGNGTTSSCEMPCRKCGHRFGQKEGAAPGCGRPKKFDKNGCFRQGCGRKGCGRKKCGQEKSGQNKYGHRAGAEA